MSSGSRTGALRSSTIAWRALSSAVSRASSGDQSPAFVAPLAWVRKRSRSYLAPKTLRTASSSWRSGIRPSVTASTIASTGKADSGLADAVCPAARAIALHSARSMPSKLPGPAMGGAARSMFSASLSDSTSRPKATLPGGVLRRIPATSRSFSVRSSGVRRSVQLAPSVRRHASTLASSLSSA